MNNWKWTGGFLCNGEQRLSPAMAWLMIPYDFAIKAACRDILAPFPRTPAKVKELLSQQRSLVNAAKSRAGA